MKNKQYQGEEYLYQTIGNALRKLFLKIWKHIEPDPVLNPTQQDIMDIFTLYLNDDDNVRYLEPDSERKYIVSKEYVLNRNINGLFIMLDSRKITLIEIDENKNNKQDYDNKSDLHEKTVKKMNEMFDEKVKQDRAQMRDDINKNLKNNLEIILDNLKKKKSEAI